MGDPNHNGEGKGRAVVVASTKAGGACWLGRVMEDAVIDIGIVRS